MIPILYAAAETEFQTNGLGALYDAISCKARQELNGQYELTMQYPVDGLHFKDLALRAIIKAKPDTVTDPQPFRAYRITKPINGIVTVYARHLVYDTSGIPVSPFSASGAPAALVALKNNAAVECPFEFRTTKSGGAEMKVSAPASIWSLMGGTEGSLLDLYGGEYSYDVYTVTLNTRRGADNGVAIRYGKNLTDLEQDANCASCYTGVYPYWHLENELVTLPEKILHAAGNFGYTRILPLDMTERFENKPTEEALRSAATKYMEDNEIGVPKVSWKVEFVALEQTEEYKGQGFLERISLGDTVRVEFDELGVNASARAVETVYDVLAERYDSTTLGRVRSNLAQTIVDQQKELDKQPGKMQSLAEKISESLAAALLGANGGAIRWLDTNNDGYPDELYIGDHPDPAQAIKVWRFNYEGWAASKNGYNGPFVLGATLDEGILAHFISVVSLFAQDITMTGTFVNTTDAFLEPNKAVLDTINNHLLHVETIPDEKIPLYDFDNSGAVTISDLVLCQSVILGKASLAGWSGAKKTPVTVTINLSDPARAMVLSGTDMWGNYRESIVGVDPATATFVAKESLADRVIESGADDVWHYCVWASGRKEMWARVELIPEAEDVHGSDYYSTQISLPSPLVFDEAAIVSGNADYLYSIANASYYAEDQTIRFRLVRGRELEALPVPIRLYVTGQ